MTYIVDQLFPPICEEDEESAIEYSNFNYWRDPISYFDDIENDLSLNSSLTTNKNLSTISENGVSSGSIGIGTK